VFLKVYASKTRPSVEEICHYLPTSFMASLQKLYLFDG
jgi:hypothetical protein